MPDRALRSLAERVPIVLGNRVVGGLPAVAVDARQGMADLLTELAGLGHRTVTCLDGGESMGLLAAHLLVRLLLGGQAPPALSDRGRTARTFMHLHVSRAPLDGGPSRSGDSIVRGRHFT